MNNILGAAGNGNINGKSELESSKELLDLEGIDFAMDDQNRIMEMHFEADKLEKHHILHQFLLAKLLKY